MKSIGIIDSGLGGYTIYHQLHQLYPELSFTFIADQKNSPYGTKTLDQLMEIGDRLCQFCLKHDILDVIVACNTLSATVLKPLSLKYPQLQLISIIDVTLASLNDYAYQPQSVTVIATEATVKSGVYQSILNQQYPSLDAKVAISYRLATLIEQLASDQEIQQELDTCLSDESIVVLGCTHYPLVKHLLSGYIVIDALSNVGLLIDKLRYLPKGKSVVYTTSISEYLQKQIEILYKTKQTVKEVVL